MKMTEEEIVAHPYREAFRHAAAAWESPVTLALHGIEEPIALVRVCSWIFKNMLEEPLNADISMGTMGVGAAMRGFVAGYLFAKEESDE